MISAFRDMVAEFERTKAAFEAAQRKLEQGRRQCAHLWGPTQYDPIRTKGYEKQDLMGHFTVSQDGHVNAPTVYIPPTETPQWVRTCEHCGLTETTRQTTEQKSYTPKFGQ